MSDRAKLKALAMAATPGPWESDMDIFSMDDGYQATVSDPEVKLLALLGTDIAVHQAPDPWTQADIEERDRRSALARQSQALRDAEFIAAANPTTILALLAEIGELEKALGEARAALRQLNVDMHDIGEELLAQSGNGKDTPRGDRLALLASSLAAANRELERWRHGVTIEGDFVCPNELEAANLRGENERLRAEVAETNAALDAALSKDIGNEKLINVMRRRYGREARQWEANHEQRKQERDEANARNESMRAVVQAALRWHREMDWCASRSPGEMFTCETLLVSAIDSTLSPKGDGRG